MDYSNLLKGDTKSVGFNPPKLASIELELTNLSYSVSSGYGVVIAFGGRYRLCESNIQIINTAYKDYMLNRSEIQGSGLPLVTGSASLIETFGGLGYEQGQQKNGKPER